MPARAFIALVTALVCPACALVIPFDLDDESGAARCDDGVDNDADGDVDCADEGCFGESFCEETIANDRRLCRDGADNDLDGLTDTFDPRCWTDQTPNVARCGSVAGSDLELGAADPLWAGSGRLDAVFAAGGEREALRVDAGGELRVADVITGGSAFLVAARLVLEDGASVRIELESRRGLYGQAGRAVVVTVDVVGDAVRLGLAGESPDRPAVPVAEVTVPRGARDDGVDEVSVRKDGLSGRFAIGWNGDEALAPATVDNPPVVFGDAQQLVVRFGNVAARPWWLVDAAVRRDRFDPCQQPFPLTGQGAEPAAEAVQAFAGARERYCVVLERDGVLSSYTAVRDPGDTYVGIRSALRRRFAPFEGPFPFVFENDDRVRVPHPVLAWDPIRAVFRGAGQPEDSGEVVLFESRDCMRWRLEGPAGIALDGAPPGAVLGYDVDSRAGGEAHHLAILEDPRTPAAVARMYDSTGPEPGAPGSFVPGEAVEFPTTRPARPSAAWIWTEGDRFPLGPNEEGGLGQLSGVTTLLFEPSGEPGTFDSDAIEQGVLWLPPVEDYRGSEWWGVLAYTARSCALCAPRFGLAYVAPAGFLSLN